MGDLDAEDDDRRPPSRTAGLALGVLLPLVVCLLLSAVRDTMANTNAALVLVLVVVAAASLGSRATGWVAALVSAAGFDVLLTQPYGKPTIHSAADVETTVLLLVIGVAVTELASWGRRQQSRASQQQGYLEGILESTGALASAGSTGTLIGQVETQLVDLLDLDTAQYVARSAGPAPVMGPDGIVHHRDHLLDVDRSGLPTDTEVWLPVGSADGTELGGFRLVAATHVARPNRQQRQVAALLAEHVASALRQETRR
jgi:K+-sensing histidine kinase KdpD